ncbi:Uncharacterized protein Adt_06280 [Abeliophyllum distichum]|uniref:Retrotransposon gag domain-containing protein n=1 Tax=Abeliophyllum distichum TaxID=126358 RepID=A0ABD1V6G6_9LAMI
MQVFQEKEESLQGYLARFSRATLGIKDLQMSAVVTAIMNGTRNRAFKMSLSKNPPESMHDLLKKGDKYVDAEEADIVTKSLREEREPETHKRKSHDDQKMTNKGKQRVVHTSKDNTRDRSLDRSMKILEHIPPEYSTYKSVDGNMRYERPRMA